MHTITADSKKRVRLPDAGPNQVYDYAASPEGVITLTPVKKAEPKVIYGKLAMRNGVLVAVMPDGSPVDPSGIVEAVKLSREDRDEQIRKSFEE